MRHSELPSEETLRGLGLELGWHSVQTLSLGTRSRTRALEFVAADEPLALFVLSQSHQAARAASLAYSRESRYVVLWSQARVELQETRRWTKTPGDSPLLAADADDVAGVNDLVRRLRREDVLFATPSALATRGTEHQSLHDSLAQVLRVLRLEVAESEAYAGHSPAGLDTSVLRLFHQLLYIRIDEDRRRRRGWRRIEELIHEDHLDASLEALINLYRSNLNSELFDPAGVNISALPIGALRRVLVNLVEPWQKLRLDFSVARSELPGRLYQSYLASLPAEAPNAAGRLFPVANTVDQREKQASYYTAPALAWLITSRTLERYCRRHRPTSPEEIRILDPACGSGAFLTAALRWLCMYFERRNGHPLRSAEREAIVRESIFGADIDERALGLTQVQLLDEANLRGKLPRLGGSLLHGDSLAALPGDPPKMGAVDWSSALEVAGPFTSVVTNPPFGSQSKLSSRLNVEAISEVVERFPEVRKFGQDYAFFFLALARRLMTDDSTAGFLLPRTFLDNSSGASARAFFLDAGVSLIADFRAAALFPGVRRALCAVVLDSARPASVEAIDVADSRDNPAGMLDDLNAGTSSRSVARASLRSQAAAGWAPFRLRWMDDLASEVQKQTAPLEDGEASERSVHSGVRPAAVDRLVIPAERWRERGGKIEVDGLGVPKRFLPRLVYAGDVQPFRLTEAGRRLVYPFESDGSPTTDPATRQLIKRLGGLPRNYRHGDVPVLRGPKVLIRGLSREPASVADPTGEHLPILRGVFAVRFGDLAPDQLDGVATLLNASFYQWLLRGFGAPLQDESVELSVSNIGRLPLPRLSPALLNHLAGLAENVRDTLAAEPMRRPKAFALARAEVDEAVFDALGASQRLRRIVREELVRLA